MLRSGGSLPFVVAPFLGPGRCSAPALHLCLEFIVESHEWGRLGLPWGRRTLTAPFRRISLINLGLKLGFKGHWDSLSLFLALYCGGQFGGAAVAKPEEMALLWDRRMPAPVKKPWAVVPKALPIAPLQPSLSQPPLPSSLRRRFYGTFRRLVLGWLRAALVGLTSRPPRLLDSWP